MKKTKAQLEAELRSLRAKLANAQGLAAERLDRIGNLEAGIADRNAKSPNSNRASSPLTQSARIGRPAPATSCARGGGVRSTQSSTRIEASNDIHRNHCARSVYRDAALEAIKLAICIRVILPRLVPAMRIYLLAKAAREKTEMEMEYRK